MIQLINVSKTYSNGVKALNNINLTINDGEFIAIIGLSGAGKSTLLRLVNKMIEATEGKVIVNGNDISNLKGKKLRDLRKEIGMIFQSFNLVKRLSVFKNVLTGRVAYNPTWRTLLGLFPIQDKLIALNSLDEMGIVDKAFIRADQLSGGQQQRVALARALSQQPKIILADEPVASLDPITTVQVMNDFEKINKGFGITVIANMHHVDLALKYATRIIGVKGGEIVFDGKPTDITDEILVKIYGRQLKHNEVLGD